MPTATATEANPTHHVTLEESGGSTYGFVLCRPDGRVDWRAINRTPMNRTSIKTSSGSIEHSDLEEPFISIPQSDWSGGRGSEDFHRDRSKFFDSFRVNTMAEARCILGPQANYSTGHRTFEQNMPGSVTWQALTGSQRYLSYKFTNTDAFTSLRAWLWIRKVGTPNGVITVELCSDSAGDPDTVLKSTTLAVASVTDVASKFHPFSWASGQALGGSTDYHIKVYGASGDDGDNHWEVAVNNASGNTQQSADNSSWSAASVDLYYRCTGAITRKNTLFFEYKGALYMVTVPDKESDTSKLYINGDRGAADANTGALGTLEDATKSWATNEWANCVVVLTAGTGHTDEQNWRVIASNDANTLTISGDNWDTTHDTTTEYVILGSDKWTERGTPGLGRVTDVVVSKGVMYFAQGEGTNIRRHREYNNSGTWTISDYADDSTNKATYLEVLNHPVDGQQVWRANNGDDPAVSRANVQAWGDDLSFGSDIVCGDRNTKITGLERYGDPERLWVFKEDIPGYIDNDIFHPIPLREMATVRSLKNGRAHAVHNVYMYFSLLHGVQRYYRDNLDDMGPNLGAGLPADRQGPVYHMTGYPGVIFAAVDGYLTNRSSVLAYNQFGWHEYYRSPHESLRIRRIHIQPIPGTTVDRMWINHGADVVWLPMPSDTLDPYRDSNYTYTHEGHLISAWHYASMQDVVKFWNSLTVFAENLTAGAQVIEGEYQSEGDDETDPWTSLNGTFDTVPSEEVDFTSDDSLTAKRIRYRLRLLTNDNSKTPKLKATVIEALGRIPPKFKYDFTFKTGDENLDIEGDDDSYTAVETLMTQLDTWASSGTPLTMRCVYSPFDNKTVFIDPTSLRPTTLIPDDQLESHVGQLTVVEK